VKTVYLGLGSNVGDREASLRTALQRLESPDLRICRVSSIYETAAMDCRNQPDFLNCVAEGETELLPMRLLQRVQRIEREMGRIRNIAKGPRNIDIDILLYGNAVIRTAKLEVPHPRMVERRFVLEPLCELAPDARHPVSRQTFRELLAAAPQERVVRLPVNLRLELP
jgi:2-amino-4-hydroxy-6-hydroxymethyldihydropteridine diphosphokinase